MIENTTIVHREQLMSIVEDSGQFDEEGLAHVRNTLDKHLNNPGSEIWYTAVNNGEPIGVAYCAPEPMTSGTWNLLMLWMKEGFSGHGYGSEIVAALERELKQRNARLLIVETSHLKGFKAARNFYSKLGFSLEAEIKNYFDAGDNKLIYTKSLI